MEISGRADLDDLVLATVLALGVPLEDKRYPVMGVLAATRTRSHSSEVSVPG